MLRHAYGFALAKGHDTPVLQAYLGHRSIQSTVRYAELAPGRFKNLWRLSRGRPVALPPPSSRQVYEPPEPRHAVVML